ncbi:uncharacterized protein [Chelonus insularis]|uniref:uncharacterized protein n=1 Tax=Chelonus insularis TaxID=460826 RepID=UPI00158A31B5|nr:uncharacterized protein LOC118071103 [Chelonus insularis]
MPLHMVSNIYWKDFFKTLRPAFSMPSKDQISNKYLNEIYEEMKSAVENKIKKAYSVGVQCDSWTNVRGESILNFVVTTPEPVYYRSIATGKASQTVTKLASEISSVIDSIGTSKVAAVCTDNASSMKAAWNLVDAMYEEKIQFYGCVAHILNNLIKEIIILPTFQTHNNNAVSVVKEIKKSNILLATLTSIQKNSTDNEKTTLKVPGQTRWGSYVLTYESLLKNKQNLKSLAIDIKVEKRLSLESKNTLLSDEFWVTLNRILTLLKPIMKWITILEGDGGTINLAYQAFYDIEKLFKKELKNSSVSILTSEETKSVFEILEKKRHSALKPIHYAADILSPTQKGKFLTEEEEASGTSLITDLAKKF